MFADFNIWVKESPENVLEVLMDIESILAKLSSEVEELSFAEPVHTVYNPLKYAERPHMAFWSRYGRPKKEAVFLGMNPGPWGMAQTGVPFGEVRLVNGWMKIDEDVEKPENEHPKRPVTGFDCTRSEVSGSRLWGWAKDRFGEPDNFFKRFFVVNYCPLIFLEESGRNRTPDKLKSMEREALFKPCDEALRSYIEYLGAELVIGVGRFAAERALAALEQKGVRIERISHPSPANPAANRGWAELVERELTDMGIKI